MAINPNTLAEIKRKAQNGIELVKPTADKLKVYNQYKANTPQESFSQPEQSNLAKYQKQFGADNPYVQMLANKRDYEAGNRDRARQNNANLYQNHLDESEREKFRTMSGDQLESYLQNQNQNQQPQPQRQNGTESVNYDNFRTQSATIEDIAKKYGFDYSREYAKSQAETLAQQKRDAAQQQLKNVDNSVSSATDALDRNYFQQFLQTQQAQTNNGINAGIADNQNLRLNMARQSAMGDIYQQADEQRFQINNDLSRIEQERIAYEDQLYNERRQQGFDNAMELSGQRQQENLAMLQATLQERGQNIDMSQFSQQQQMELAKMVEQKRQFDQSQAQDMTQFEAQLNQDAEKFNRQLQLSYDELDQDMQQFMDKMGWEREQFNSLSAAERAQIQQGYARINQQKRQFESEQAWRQYSFNNMSAREQAQINLDAQKFGENMAWKIREMEAAIEMEAGNYAAATDWLYGLAPGEGNIGAQGSPSGGQQSILR